MPVTHDRYVINLYYSNQKVDLSAQEYSFSISDSIFSLYPTGTFTLHDLSGMFQEGLITSEGSEVDIEYGDKDVVNVCSFTALNDELSDIRHDSMLRGYVDIPLIHSWYSQQQLVQKGWKDSIGNIVEEIAGSAFSEVDIDPAENDDYWLQANQTDASFIKNTLLPNAFSPSANGSPYFAYITSDNVFHFKNSYSLSTERTIDTIEYKRLTDQKDPSVPNVRGIIGQLRRWKQSSKDHWKDRRKVIYQISRTTGDLETNETTILDHPTKQGWVLPILSDNSLVTGSLNNLFTETNPARKQNKLGLVNNSYRESNFTDFFQVIIQFDPRMHAGNLVNLRIYTPEKDNTKLSSNFSGQYTIINCDHIWNGENSIGYTALTLGRKYIDVPSSYNLKPKLIQ